jgi:hypothetical protein
MADRKIKKNIKIVYQLITDIPINIEQGVDQAFDILFDHVLNYYKINKKEDGK